MMRGDGADVPFVCGDGSAPRPDADALQFWKAVGAVGGSSSTISVQLASLFRLFFIPQVQLHHPLPNTVSTHRFSNWFSRDHKHNKHTQVCTRTTKRKLVHKSLGRFGTALVSILVYSAPVLPLFPDRWHR